MNPRYFLGSEVRKFSIATLTFPMNIISIINRKSDRLNNVGLTDISIVGHSGSSGISTSRRPGRGVASRVCKRAAMTTRSQCILGSLIISSVHISLTKDSNFGQLGNPPNINWRIWAHLSSHIMTPPKDGKLARTSCTMVVRVGMSIYPLPAAVLDPGTPRKILTFLFGEILFAK